MIRVETEGPVGDAYAAWREKARKAREDLIKEWQEWKASKARGDECAKPEPKQRIWKELKELFINKIFHDKCAYCEGRTKAQNPLDVEHYRPKMAVTDDRRPLPDHDGYYWLAYEWFNLILSCRNCNSNHSSSDKGKKVTHPGKFNEFRVRGSRTVEPSADPDAWRDELRSEQPLLLNPYDGDDDPAKHIAFDENGVPYPKDGSERGRETIKVCHLYRIELVEARLAAQSNLRDRLIERLYKPGNDPYFGPSDEYSAWLNQAMGFKLKELAQPCAPDLVPLSGTTPVPVSG